ncbi:MAG: chemotaxis protein CheB [Chloroflexi bacterium]|nr:chemotaxis protein CheB [Chloroflexota bacterium]
MANCSTIIIVGASTGGPQTVRSLMTRLPVLDACVLIVLHMPKYINASVRKSMSAVTPMKVELAADGMALENGLILIAPSETHMVLENNQRVRLVDGKKVNYVRPSIDITMKSVTRDGDVHVIGIVLTGMGSDGAKGISHIKDLGGATFAQDESTCVVYGMPKAAVETGKVDFILPPEEIADKVAEMIGNMRDSQADPGIQGNGSPSAVKLK